MDLSRDWIVTPGDVEASACRWFVNIYHCRNSTFFVVGTSIVLACSTLCLFMVMFFVQRRRLYLDIFRGSSRWSHLLLLCLLFSLGMIFYILHAIMMLADVPMSYASRHALRCVAIFFLFSTAVPHVIHLVSLVGRTDMDTIHYGLTKRSTQAVAYTITLSLFIAGILDVISFAQIDEGNPVAYRWLFTVGCILYIYPCAVVIWFYQAYGIRFAEIIDTHLEDLGARSVRRAGSIGALKQMELPCQQSAAVSSSLQKMKIIYSSVVLAVILAIINLIMMASVPNETFTLPVFSEILFFLHYMCTNLFIFFTLILLLIFQLKDKRTRRGGTASMSEEASSQTAPSHDFPWSLPDPPPRTSGDDPYVAFQPWERNSPHHSLSTMG